MNTNVTEIDVNTGKVTERPANAKEEAFYNAPESVQEAVPTMEERVATVEADMVNMKSEMEDFNYIFTGEEKSHAE